MSETLKEAKPAETNRWDIDEDGDDLLVCKGAHDKGEKCEFTRYVPAAKVEALIADRNNWVSIAKAYAARVEAERDEDQTIIHELQEQVMRDGAIAYRDIAALKSDRDTALCSGESARREAIKECAKIAKRQRENDLEYAQRYPDEARKMEDRAHRAGTIEAAICALLDAPADGKMTASERAAVLFAKTQAERSGKPQSEACESCGSTRTMADLRASGHLSCCPERKMISIDEWRTRAIKAEENDRVSRELLNAATAQVVDARDAVIAEAAEAVLAAGGDNAELHAEVIRALLGATPSGSAAARAFVEKHG